MVSQEEYTRKEGLEITLYILLGVVMSILLPIFIGFGLKGFEESFVPGRPFAFGDILANYQIYYVLIFAAACAIIPAIISLFIIRKGEHPATQENPTLWRILSVSLIHDPERGALYTLFRKFGVNKQKDWFKWSISMLRVFVIAIIVFGSLGVLQVAFPSLQIVAVPNFVLQQITPITQVYFTAEPAAFAETGTMLLVFELLMGLVAFLCARFISGDDNKILAYFLIGFFLICPLIGLLWMGFHNIVYQNSAQAQFATFIFGWFGSTLTLMFGTFIFWYVWHFMNNLFAKIAEISPSNANVMVISIFILVLILVSYIAIEWKYYKKRKKEFGFQEPKF